MVTAALLPFLQRFNPTVNIYADLPNHRACESAPATIPHHNWDHCRPDSFITGGKRATILRIHSAIE